MVEQTIRQQEHSSLEYLSVIIIICDSAKDDSLNCYIYQSKSKLILKKLILVRVCCKNYYTILAYLIGIVLKRCQKNQLHFKNFIDQSLLFLDKFFCQCDLNLIKALGMRVGLLIPKVQDSQNSVLLTCHKCPRALTSKKCFARMTCGFLGWHGDFTLIVGFLASQA